MKNDSSLPPVRPHEAIVALDVPSAREAAAAVAKIGDAVSFYKVGLELFVADGPETLKMLRGEGKRVFLDLKLHDIPRPPHGPRAGLFRHGRRRGPRGRRRRVGHEDPCRHAPHEP